jgi:H+-transporting ATPase
MKDAAISTKEATTFSIDEIFQRLSTNKKGLSTSEATERLQSYGLNEIIEKQINPLVKFLGYFWGPIPFMIEIAAILSAIISHWEDFIIIIALLLLNAFVGFFQEHKAGNAIALLKQKLSPSARVLRDAKWRELPAREVVPGDIVRIRLGDIVPADIKLIDGEYISVDESALTGESLPVEKHISDIAYASAIIRQGEMDALVVTTGMNTYFGKTTKLVEEGETKSHFQKAVVKIGDYLIALAAILVIIIFFAAIFRSESLVDTFQFVLVLVVASIPVALPAVLSVTMAIGATALAKKEAIVSKLVAIEEMAGMDILCSDKTGTITQNKLSIAEIDPLEGFTDQDVLLFATLASREEDQDPIDTTIISKAKTQPALTELLGHYTVTNFKPFDPVKKRTEATLKDVAGNQFQVAKGAPQIILSLVLNKEVITDRVNAHIDAFASKGYRTIGVARTDAQGNWQFVGLIPLHDPPQDDSAETIATAQKMGVEVKMVTGDHVAIAKEIAKEVHLGTNILPVSSFLDKPDKEAQRVVESANGFAQVFPEHKYRIVELLQEKDHIVGMTGDGVNDAPALKKADAGIAVAGATDAAKSAADVVFTKPGLSVIIDAIKESRKIFQRMNNYALYRITETIRVLIFMTASILVFNFYPVTAIMIVLLALLNDAPIMSIAYDNVHYSDQPARWNMRQILAMATFLGFIGVVSSFGLFYIGQVVLKLSPEVIQSFIYLKLSVAGHLVLFVARTRGPFWSIRPSKILFLAIVTTQLIATFITVYGVFFAPIGWSLALFVWGYALIAFLITDFIKVRLYRLIDHRGIKFHR